MRRLLLNKTMQSAGTSQHYNIIVYYILVLLLLWSVDRRWAVVVVVVVPKSFRPSCFWYTIFFVDRGPCQPQATPTRARHNRSDRRDHLWSDIMLVSALGRRRRHGNCAKIAAGDMLTYFYVRVVHTVIKLILYSETSIRLFFYILLYTSIVFTYP